MKIKIYIFFWVLILISCNPKSKTEKNVFNNNTFDEKFEIKNSVFKQSFSIKTGQQQKIVGEKGTIIIFSAKCFGEISGVVKIELIECYSIQDMIFNSLSTQTTDCKLLETDGMIYLSAISEKGDTLEIVNNKQVIVSIPSKHQKKSMQIFEGIEINNSISWKLTNEKFIVNNFSINNNSSRPNVSINYESSAPKDSFFQPKIIKSQIHIDKQIKNENLVNYVFNITKLGWINCDRFIEGETQDLFVNVKEEYKNIKLYLVFDELNSNVLPLWPEPVKGQIKFTNISLNSSFTLIGIATKGDKIYFGMDNYSTHKGIVDCPELKAVTRQDLTDLLMKKFGKDIWHRPLA